MDSTTLEARVAFLERSLRRNRATTVALGLAVFVASAGAFIQQPTSLEAQLEERLTGRLQTILTQQLQEQSQEQVATQRLALTNELGVEMVALRAGTDGSLLVLTPDGREVLRLGGHPLRHVEH